jgi:hypothetical protein
MPPTSPSDSRVNEVARQAGAIPISLPMEDPPTTAIFSGGEISPTGVVDILTYSSWTDTKDAPSWYANGDDVDALLDVAESLDWLTDTGDLNEPYQSSSDEHDQFLNHQDQKTMYGGNANNNTSVTTLPHVDSNVDSIVPSLPDLFDGVHESSNSFQHLTKGVISSSNLLRQSQSVASIGTHLQVFDSPMEEHDFVSTILESSNVDLHDFV